MLAVPCPVHDRTVLIWPSQLLEITNTAAGIEVSYRCHCGALAVWRTGRSAARSELLSHRLATLDERAATVPSAPLPAYHARFLPEEVVTAPVG